MRDISNRNLGGQHATIAREVKVREVDSDKGRTLLKSVTAFQKGGLRPKGELGKTGGLNKFVPFRTNTQESFKEDKENLFVEEPAIES